MTRRRSGPFVFDKIAYLAATRGDEPRAIAWAEKVGEEKRYRALVKAVDGGSKAQKAAIELLDACQWDAEEAKRIINLLDKHLWSPPAIKKGGKGRPSEWGSGKKLFAWLAVEAQYRADIRRGLAKSVAETINKKFRGLPKRGDGYWHVAFDGSSDKPLRLSRETAKKYHEEGIQILARGRCSRGMWDRLAEVRADSICEAEKKFAR